MASKGIALFVIPIVFSFVYGGLVLGSAMQGPQVNSMTAPSSTLEILELQGSYSSGERVSVQISINDASYDCGDLYITVYDVAGGAKKAVKQGAFFDQCYGTSGTLPISEKFSENFDAGQYSLEAQLFDKTGDKFLSATQKFSVQ